LEDGLRGFDLISKEFPGNRHRWRYDSRKIEGNLIYASELSICFYGVHSDLQSLLDFTASV